MNRYSNLKTLTVQISKNTPGIAYLSFNRPKAMNTYNIEMSEELPGCIETISEDNDIKLLVLRGAEHVFMAGGDIDFLKQASQGTEEMTRAAISSLNESIMALCSMDKLVVAAVHGACAGAGMSLMMAADFAYAASGTKFNPAYINLGLTPDGGMSYLLPRFVGHRKALELIICSEQFLAEDALKIGLINQVLPANNFFEQIEVIAQNLVRKSKLATANVKKLMKDTWHNNLSQQLSAEQDSFVACTKTQDFVLNVEAFLNKEKNK
jgi:2-(1,2-epoxy-1,2-dihydrophenyl)acetyl-CoA isomerase